MTQTLLRRAGRCRALLLCSCLLAAGCAGDKPTDTEGPLTLAVIGRIASVDLFDPLPHRAASLQCVGELSLVASGRDGATARLAVSKVRYFQGPDRTVAVDSAVLDPADLTRFWEGGGTIAAGQTRSINIARDRFLPFTMEVDLRYTVEGTQHSAPPVRLDCGPAVPNPQPPTPAITSVSPATEARLGADSVVVRYSAQSSAGLWLTEVRVSGAFQDSIVLAERFATTSTRRVAFAVPTGAEVGRAVRVSVRAVDVAGQARGAEVDGPTVRAAAPPVLTFLEALDSSLPTGGADAFVAQGDTLWLAAGIQDNFGLKWLVYEIGDPVGVRDSIPLEGALPYFVPIVARSTWSGRPNLWAYVRDVGGQRSNSLEVPAGRIHFFPVRRATHVQRTLAGEVHSVAPDPARSQAFVSLRSTTGSEHGIHRMPLGTLATNAVFGRGETMTRIDVDPHGSPMGVPESDAAALYLFDGADPAAAARRRTFAGGIVGFAAAPDGGALVLALKGLGTQLFRALPAGDSALLAEDGWTSGEDGVGRSLDRRRALVEMGRCGRVVELATWTLGDCRSIERVYPQDGAARHLFSGDQTGARFNKGAMVVDDDLGLVFLDDFGNGEPPAALSPDGATLYVARRGGILRIRLSDGLVLDRLPYENATHLAVSGSGILLAARSAAGESTLWAITLP